MIIDSLIEKIKECNNPSVVGLDTMVSYLPDNEGIRIIIPPASGYWSSIRLLLTISMI